MYSYAVSSTPPRPSTATSSGSSSSGYTSQHQASQRVPGDVPTAVHNLLSSTGQLQDLLRQWSVGRASETQVSDLYVKIGTDFNTTLNAFLHHNIELADLYSIPKELRGVLEHCLSEDPSSQALEMYMPQVRQVLYKLLKGLQMRQDIWRAKAGVSFSPSLPAPPYYSAQHVGSSVSGRPLPSPHPTPAAYETRR
ncbi:hypothetical protein AX17_006835 [Amanita inopinata Kibby_2008]|nr:hypothetical protein AX17_006835 [Amanita inopinata Kibby_2008]